MRRCLSIIKFYLIMDSLRNNYTFCHNRNNFFRMSGEMIENCVMQADTTASSSFHALKKFGFWPCVYWNNLKFWLQRKIHTKNLTKNNSNMANLSNLFTPTLLGLVHHFRTYRQATCKIRSDRNCSEHSDLSYS